ncbi:DUF421 domain-containing protein [Paenibacillus sp. PK3_47]|uniref:DUF421 domain-containing protein n=1 Tax=Paenibacillus sp. PK3_47 TaxID=2072642 RepID=UPI00201E665A|nr:DUF421 domain-containing protein [Paenibacillus sp. PK3_47]UQZ32307.1 DUF421 domain-containing protein [Paenibacillus sp. PK3_47]
MDYGLILIKLLAGFIGLWTMTRLLGKKEIAALTPFDFISAVILGDLVGETIYEPDHKVGMLIFTLAIWTVLSYTFEKITLKFRNLRKPLEGEAEILIRNGEIDLGKLRKNNLDFDQLRMMLRAKDTFSVSEVAYAIYETNGSLSIMKKAQYEGVTRSDLQLPDKELTLPKSIIEDGIVRMETLNSLGHNESWLSVELRKLGYHSPQSVAYAEITEDGKLTVISSVSH